MSRMRVELSCRAVGAKGPGVRGSGDIECFMAIPDIGRSVKPISTRLVDYAYHITTCTPGFSDLPTALFFAAGRVIMINLGCQASRRILPFLYLDVSPLTPQTSLLKLIFSALLCKKTDRWIRSVAR